MAENSLLTLLLGLGLLTVGTLGYIGRLGKGTSIGWYSVFNYTGYIFSGLFFLATTVMLNADDGSSLKTIAGLLAAPLLLLVIYSILIHPPRWAQPGWQRTLDDHYRTARRNGKEVVLIDTSTNKDTSKVGAYDNESAASFMHKNVLSAGETISRDEILTLLKERDALVNNGGLTYNPQTALMKICEGRGINTKLTNLLDEGEAQYLNSIGLS
ncbi:MAG TPA: hypothetical protein VK983_05560 [Candidatus Limnocylindrales bacterium]|nr:hypothetical protein [Candidatus Limnocylindrales bacterium]